MLGIGVHREEINNELDGQALRQGNSLVYPGRAVCGEGQSEEEVQRRVEGGTIAWRQNEGVVADRHISKQNKTEMCCAQVSYWHDYMAWNKVIYYRIV